MERKLEYERRKSVNDLTTVQVMQMTDEEIYDGFAAIAAAQAKVVEWVQKLKVKDADTLRDAMQIKRDIRAVKEKVAERVKQLCAPLNEREKYVKEQAKGVLNPFENSDLSVDAKIVSYNAKKKEEALAEQARIRAEQEAARRKAEAEQRQRDAAEERRQLEEAQRIAELNRQAKDAAKKKDVAAQLEAENKRREEEARIEKERAERQQKEAAELAQKKLEEERAERERMDELAKAKGREKTRGVQSRWTYDIVDPDQVPREYCDPAPKKLNAVVQAGIRQIPGCHIYQKMNTTLAGSN